MNNKFLNMFAFSTSFTCFALTLPVQAFDIKPTSQNHRYIPSQDYSFTRLNKSYTATTYLNPIQKLLPPSPGDNVLTFLNDYYKNNSAQPLSFIGAVNSLEGEVYIRDYYACGNTSPYCGNGILPATTIIKQSITPWKTVGAALSLAYSPKQGSSDPIPNINQNINNVYWVQIIDYSINGIAQPRKLDTSNNLPFYPSQLVINGSTPDTTLLTFIDAPQREAIHLKHNWTASLYLVELLADYQVKLYNGISWGWYNDNFQAVPTPSPTPSNIKCSIYVSKQLKAECDRKRKVRRIYLSRTEGTRIGGFASGQCPSSGCVGGWYWDDSEGVYYIEEVYYEDEIKPNLYYSSYDSYFYKLDGGGGYGGVGGCFGSGSSGGGGCQSVASNLSVTNSTDNLSPAEAILDQPLLALRALPNELPALEPQSVLSDESFSTTPNTSVSDRREELEQGDEYQSANTVSVPEPSSILGLLGMGTLAWSSLRHKRANCYQSNSQRKR